MSGSESSFEEAEMVGNVPARPRPRQRNFARVVHSQKERRKACDAQVKSQVVRNIELDMLTPLGVYFSVGVTHINNVNRMYLRWESTIASNVSLSDMKHERLVVKDSLDVNEYCMVRYPGDPRNSKGTYRGCIVALLNTDGAYGCRVHLVDIGVDIKVPSDQVYELPGKYLDQRRMCFKFGLLNYIQVKTEQAVSETQEYLYDMFSSHRVSVRIESKVKSETGSRTRLYGDVYFSDYDLKTVEEARNVYSDLLSSACILEYKRTDFTMIEQELISKTTVPAKASEVQRLKMGQPEPVWVCPGAKSLNDFYVIGASRRVLKNKLDDLIDRSDSLGLESYQPWEKDTGEWCLVRPEGYTTWLRAKVLHICGKDVSLQLLDYGGIAWEKLCFLKRMPEFARNVPALGIHCTLPVKPVGDKYNPRIVNNLCNFNDLDEVTVLAHVIQYVDQQSFEVDLEVKYRIRGRESFSFSENLVQSSEAMWKNLEYARHQLYITVMPRAKDTRDEDDEETHDDSGEETHNHFT